MEYITQNYEKMCFDILDILERGMYIDVKKKWCIAYLTNYYRAQFRRQNLVVAKQVAEFTLASGILKFFHLFSGTVEFLLTIIHPYYYLQQNFLKVQSICKFAFLAPIFISKNKLSWTFSKYNSTFHSFLGAWNIQ